MAFDLIRRNWHAFVKPPAPPSKSDDVVKFGILGTSDAALMALIGPAKQHPEVVVEAVAEEDGQRVEAFARRHGIGRWFSSCQDLINDPSIDAVYISLPTARPNPTDLQVKWALKGLSAGKHVLLEPSTLANTTNAKLLFRSPLLTAQHHDPSLHSPPVLLLEALPYRFHPAWLAFESLLDKPRVEHAEVTITIPIPVPTSISAALASSPFSSFFSSSSPPSSSKTTRSSKETTAPHPNPHLHQDPPAQHHPTPRPPNPLSHDMKVAHQALSLLRTIFAADPLHCARSSSMVPWHVLHASTWLFPNGGTGEVKVCVQGGNPHQACASGNARDGASASGGGMAPFVRVFVREGEKEIREGARGENGIKEGKEKVVTKEMELRAYFSGAPLWNRIEVRDEYVVRRNADGKVAKRWTEKVEKALRKGVYTLREAGVERESEPHWTAARYLLEEFVNRVKGREGTGAWVGAEASLGVARMEEMAYGM